MTILFFPRFFYPHIGGVEKHVYEISKLLIKNGYNVTVVTEDLNKAALQENFEGIEVYRIPLGRDSWIKKFTIWKWLWQHRRLIEQADIIHCHDVFFWYLPFRFLFPLKPVYTTFHGYESYPITQKAIIQHKIAEILSRGNICIGDFISKWYGTKPTFVSYGGVSLQQKKVNKLSYDAVFIGRLDNQTGITMYADAVQIVRKKYPKFSLLIVGNGSLRSQAEKIGEVIGFKENAEDYLQKGKFAFVSRYLAMLEAMASRKLVFAVFDNPIKKDYLLMSPFAQFAIVESNSKDLAKKIEYYIEHPKEADKIISKAYSWAKEQTWKKVSNIYISLWRKQYGFS